MPVSEIFVSFFKSIYRSINAADKESEREHHRKTSTLRCKWLENIVSPTCEPAWLACQVPLEKLHRIAILNINSISTRENKEEGSGEHRNYLAMFACGWESLSLFSANGGAEPVTSCEI
jgi:hypothetical protein